MTTARPRTAADHRRLKMRHAYEEAARYDAEGWPWMADTWRRAASKQVRALAAPTPPTQTTTAEKGTP